MTILMIELCMILLHLLHPGLDKRLQVRHQIGVYCNTSFNNVRFSTRLSLTES